MSFLNAKSEPKNAVPLLKIVATILSFFIVGSFAFANNDPLGSRNNPLKFAIVPSGHGATAITSIKPLMQCIEKNSGYFTTLSVPNSYIAVAEAMGSHKIDFAFGDISSFLIARKKYGAEPFLQVMRYGYSSYQSMILVRADSPIKTFKDLDGKTFAYPDASSASGYLLPIIEMKKNGLKFSREVPSGSMDAAITSLLQKKVDAAAAYYNLPDPKTGSIRDARERVLKLFPNIDQQTRIVWLSEAIPNEPVFVRAGLPETLKQKLSTSVQQCVKELPLVVNNIEELTPITKENNNYTAYIKMLEDSGLDIVKVFSKEK